LLDAATLLDVALVPQALARLTKAGYARDALPLRREPVLIQDLVWDANVAVARGALEVQLGERDALPEAPVRRMGRQLSRALGLLLAEGRGIMLDCQR
jgi:hypothetical protein